MNTKYLFVYFVLIISLGAQGCSSVQSPATALPVPITDTATLLPTATATSTPSPTATLTPTPTNDGKYRPPQGIYACDFSSKKGVGSRMDEHYLSDSFETVLSSDFGDWYSIEFMRIGDKNLPIPENAEDRKKYLDFDLNALMERRIKSEVPKGKIIEQDYIQKDTPILLAILDLPGGSNMLVNGKRASATRAVYIVIHGAYSYAISTQFTKGIGFDGKTQKDIVQQLKQELENFYETCTFQDDLNAGKNFIAPTVTPVPDPNDFVPDMKIPEGLFFPNKGAKNFEPSYGNGNVLLTKGDWILFKAGLESILPVPKGWTTVETGQATYILFSPTGDPKQNPTIQIKLGYQGYDDDSTTSEKPIGDSIASIEQNPNFTLIKKEIIDKDKGYIFLKVITDAGTTRYVLQVVSKYANNPSGKFFHVSTISVNEADWDQYYPIIQAMFNNWHAYDGVSIAVPLPDSLTK